MNKFQVATFFTALIFTTGIAIAEPFSEEELV